MEAKRLRMSITNENDPVLSAELCVAAYMPSGRKSEQRWKDNLSEKYGSYVQTYFVNDNVLYTLELGDSFHVVVRGTDAGPDWLTNMQVRSVAPYVRRPFAMVHIGYYVSANHIWRSKTFRESVIEAVEKGLLIRVHGHSLGGGVAGALTGIILDMNYPLESLTTWGAPRHGNEAFGEWLTEEMPERVTRYVATTDPVPQLLWWTRFVPSLPLSGLWRALYHYGHYVYFAGDGQMRENPSFTWVMMDRIRHFRRTRRFVREHKMSNYLRNITLNRS